MTTDRNYKILVVDDEPDIGAIIKMGLEKNGFDVDAYSDPLAAKAQFKAGVYNLLLIDIRMPKINGFELYRELKKIDDKAKICFITAFEIYHDEFRRIFPTLKVDCFVRKPIKIDELAKLIRVELAVQDEIDFSG